MVKRRVGGRLYEVMGKPREMLRSAIAAWATENTNAFACFKRGLA
ncbi:hypothetical protein AA15669_0559 [Saccharibacter floricola DSM 15669]|uniref:Uncharacterized protein n=1 Tax=Saccharibacter floricola DSM 15669 TaxID=1123227 RepID=A0ABQ0NY42_9PROT|nr:hypothetical protein AA15669_0559 [Saccharibacter floricola DSM 15669]